MPLTQAALKILRSQFKRALTEDRKELYIVSGISCYSLLGEPEVKARKLLTDYGSLSNYRKTVCRINTRWLMRPGRYYTAKPGQSSLIRFFMEVATFQYYPRTWVNGVIRHSCRFNSVTGCFYTSAEYSGPNIAGPYLINRAHDFEEVLKYTEEEHARLQARRLYLKT